MSTAPGGTVFIAGGGTGGHLTPALALASELRRQAPEFEPVLVGATRGVEATLLPGRDFRYHLLPSEPIYRRAWWRNLRQPVVVAQLLGALRRLYAAERPVAVLGTGGYAAGPVVWWAARRGLPTALQEQNAYPGLATRWLAGRVRHLYLGLPEARAHLRPGLRTEVFETGNPIAPPTPERRAAALARFGLSGTRPVVLVTGGSQGALAINRAVAGWVRSGIDPAVDLLWVTGRGTHVEFAALHAPPRLHVIDFLDPMADGYAVADLVVSRAGMLTVAEVCAWGLPAVLIPLPTAAADHQRHNAEAMAGAGAAQLLPQAELGSARLAQVVDGLLRDSARRTRMAAAAKARGKPAAASEIVSHFLTLCDPARAFANHGPILH